MDQLLSLNEVAKRLGVSKYTVKDRIREAQIRGPRPGREMMLTEKDYQALVEHMRKRQRGEGCNPAAVKAALRKQRLLQTKRLGQKIKGQPVIALNLERPPDQK